MKYICVLFFLFTSFIFSQDKETKTDSIPPINNQFKKLSNEELMELSEEELDEYFDKLSKWEEKTGNDDISQELSVNRDGKGKERQKEKEREEEEKEEEFVVLSEEEIDELSDIELEEYYDRLAIYQAGEENKIEFQELSDEELAAMTDEELQDYYERREAAKEVYAEEDDLAFEYSLFDDFRIPKRENISNTALIADGWTTKVYNYAFRCRNKKRIRMTYWERPSEDGKIISDFINISPMPGKCLKDDKMYFDIDVNAIELKEAKKEAKEALKNVDY